MSCLIIGCWCGTLPPFGPRRSWTITAPLRNVESIAVPEGHAACFPPRQRGARGRLRVERYGGEAKHIEARIEFLPAEPALVPEPGRPARSTDRVLLTNGRGGMARLCVDLGRVLSKYDCVLGANLHPDLPVDRHVLVKRNPCLGERGRLYLAAGFPQHGFL